MKIIKPVDPRFAAQREPRYKAVSHILAEKGKVAAIGQFLLLMVASTTVANTGFDGVTGSLFITILLANIFRFGFATVYTPEVDQNKWYRGYAVATLTTAVSWSALTSYFLHVNQFSGFTAILLFLINCGIASGATAALSPDKFLARLFIGVAAIPIALTLLFGMNEPLYSFFLIVVTYAAFLYSQVEIQSNTLMHLHDRESQVQALVDASLEAIVFSREGVVVDANPMFETMFGVSVKEGIGRQLLSFAVPEDHEWAMSTMSNDGERRRMRGVRPDGTTFPVDVFGRWFFYRGERTRLTCIQDVSWRTEAEEGMRESIRQMETLSSEKEKVALDSMKMKSEFLANMSHELRTPLNAIIGLGDLLSTTPDGPLRARYLRTLKNSADSLLNLINDVLDLSKIEGDKIELETIPFSLVEVIEGQADLMSMRARDKKIALSTFVDPTLPSIVRGDFGRIGQIILNLLGNAIKFTEKGQVTINCVTVSRGDGRVRVRVEVQDTGLGITQEQGIKLFKPFTQADSSTSRKHGGTGLGLSICKRLVERMDGMISFESVIGQGTKFYFEVPLDVVEEKTLTEVHKKDAQGSINPVASGSLVTIISDFLPVQETLENYAKSWEFNCEVKTIDQYVATERDDTQVGVIVLAMKAMLPELVVTLFQQRAAGKMRVVVVDTEGVRENTVPRLNERELIDRTIDSPVRQSDFFNALNDVTVVIPAASAVSAEETEDKELFEPARILIAEDNSTNQMLTLAILRRMGMTCQAVIHGREAVEAWETGKFDLILMDCQMPEMDGYEATIEIRKREESTGRHIPIIALTANVFDSDREKCFKSGMDGFIAKPVRRKNLVEEMKNFLKLKQKAA